MNQLYKNPVQENVIFDFMKILSLKNGRIAHEEG